VLGVCLGGQLIAHVSGGEVRASFGAPERGSVPIRTLPGADEDPVFGGLPEHFPAIEHHQDRITELPPGAVHLAASDACPLQAFRLGDTAWGLQFHPETPPERLRTWDAEELRAQGIDRDALVEAALAADAEAVPAARTLLERWLGVVREVAADRGFPVIDGHNDLAWERRISQDYSLEHLDDDELTFQTDLPALRRGGVVGQFWSVFVDCEVADPLQSTLQQIDYVHRMIERHPEHLRLAFTSTEVKEAIASGRIASLLGAEGGHSIVDDLAVLRLFARLGVRYLTLTHNEDTPWADSATGQHPHGGLTDRGREIVAELERNSILVDLSHVSPATMHDALDVATRPVIFSHSGARALSDHPRNVPDDVMARLPENGGVLMLTFVPQFLSLPWHEWSENGKEGEEPVVDVALVADHIEHARGIVGIAHVGLGSDFDGINNVPRGLENVSCYPAIAEELRRRGWTPAELHALACGNILRVLKQTDPGTR
jgi:membrane dipeptidase